MIRKHVKVEPARWYYHADRLGMLVWQDMPSGDNKDDGRRRRKFARELKAMIDSAAQPSVDRHVGAVQRRLGPARRPSRSSRGSSRTIRPASVEQRQRLDRHAASATSRTSTPIPGPAMPPLEAARAAVLGEFGGLGLPLDGHTWLDRGNWGYRSFTSLDELNEAYRDLLGAAPAARGDGLAAAIYTQTTDVEIEVNGVMTYDRGRDQAVAGIGRREPAHLRPAAAHHAPRARFGSHAADLAVHDRRRRRTGLTRRSTMRRGRAAPADSARPTRGSRSVGTEWKTADIWLRRTVDVAAGHAHRAAPARLSR